MSVNDENTYIKQQRVYYEDTDAGGVVYHANYLNFMERCRCDWLDHLGFNVSELQDQTGVVFVVREANIQYRMPARLFDEVRISCRLISAGKVRLMLAQEIYKGDELLCSATIKLASLDSQSFKLTPIPNALLQALT